MYLSSNIKILRERKGMTQIKFAKKVGVNSTQISKYEKGDGFPKMENVFKIAEILGVKPGELIDRNFMDPNTAMNTMQSKDRTMEYEFLIGKIMALEEELMAKENEAKAQLDEIIATLKKKYPEVANQIGL